MGYQVLARKWRPANFRQLVGQEHVLKTLVNALDQDRLHQAYLFTGTRGVGKTTIARILAKCLNCESGVSSEPCGECEACRGIDEGRFVDLIEVDAASRTRVDDTRELLDNVQYLPTRGRFKVYLIDEVHMLSASSFNALLKTLEEPPPHIKFLFATTDPQKLPATVLSRCLQFNLKNLSAERIADYLATVMREESIETEPGALSLLARAADGSMRDALSLTDQAVSFGSGRLGEADVRDMLGTIDRSTVYELVGALAAGDAGSLLRILEKAGEQALDYRSLLQELLSVLHRIALAQAVPEQIDDSQGDAGRIRELAAALTGEDCQLFYQLGLGGVRDLDYAPDPRSGCEMVLLRMLAFRPADVPSGASQSGSQSPPPEAAGAAKKREAAPAASAVVAEKAPPARPVAEQSGATADHALHERAATGPGSREHTATGHSSPGHDPTDPEANAAVNQQQAQQKAQPPAGVAGDPASCEAPGTTASTGPEMRAAAEPLQKQELDAARWVRNFAELGLRGMAGNIASHCELAARDGSRLQLRLDADNASLFNGSQVRKLEQQLETALGAPVQVDVEIAAIRGLTPAAWSAQQQAERQARARDSIEADHCVRLLIENFDATLDPASIRPCDT